MKRSSRGDAMNRGIISVVVIASLVILAAAIAGCTSYAPSVSNASLTPASPETMHDLAIGDTASLLAGPDGNLVVTIQTFDAATGKIRIEEENTGLNPVQYEPTIWLHDAENINYTTLYCRAEICPRYVFLTTLQPRDIEKREFDSLYDTFRVPDRGRQGNITLYWSVYGQTASWNIPVQ